MTKPKALASRNEIEVVLQKAIIAALATFDEEAIDGPVGLCRVSRSLFSIGLHMLLCGGADEAVARLQVDRALARRFGTKKKAVVTEPGTLGSAILKRAKA